MGENLTFQEQCEAYKEGALKLSVEAVKNCLDNRSVKDIGCIIYSSCTGYHVPSMNYLIAKELGLPNDIEHIPLIGDGGCVGAAPALKRACDYHRLTGKMALAISCELSSCCYYPEDPNPDPRGKYQLLRSNAIFGDGASAALIGSDENPRHPEIVDSQAYTDYENQYALGLEWRNGRLACLLSQDVPNLAPEVIEKCVTPMLNRNGIDIGDIKWLVCHPGGKRVIDNIRDRLGFSEEQMGLTREALRNYGNCSSTSIGLLGKTFMDSRGESIQSGDYGLVATVGSGMQAYSLLLRW